MRRSTTVQLPEAHQAHSQLGCDTSEVLLPLACKLAAPGLLPHADTLEL
jgi:hypothetical protein